MPLQNIKNVKIDHFHSEEKIKQRRVRHRLPISLSSQKVKIWWQRKYKRKVENRLEILLMII